MKHIKMMEETVAKKVFKSKRIGRELTARIVSELLKANYDEVYQNIVPTFEEIGFSSSVINSTTDVTMETNMIYVNIEINRFNGPNKHVQMESYVYQLYLGQLKTYKDYGKIKNVIQIMIEDYDYFERDKFVYDVVYMEKELHVVEDEAIEKYHINLEYLEKQNYQEVIQSKNKLMKLLYFLICDDDKILNEMYGGDDFMKDVVNESKEIAGLMEVPLFPYTDEEVFELDKKYYIDEGIKEGIEKGFGQGLEQGILKNRQEMIINMHNHNIPLDTIAKCANLEVSEVEKIINSMK